MKRRWILPAALGLVWILGGMPAAAQSPRPALALQAGGAGHEENNLHVGLASGFGFAFPLTPRLAATVEIDHWSTESRTSSGKLYQGRLAVTPVLVGLRYEFRGNGYFAPYVVAGAGYVGTRFRIGSLVLSSPDTSVRQNVRSGGAGFLGLGASWRLSPLWEFFSEIDYLIRTAPGRTITRHPGGALSQADLWVNLHVVYWKFGLRFLF